MLFNEIQFFCCRSLCFWWQQKVHPTARCGQYCCTEQNWSQPSGSCLTGLANKPLLSKSCVRSIYMHHMPLCVYIYIYLHTHTDRHMYCNNGISYKPLYENGCSTKEINSKRSFKLSHHLFWIKQIAKLYFLPFLHFWDIFFPAYLRRAGTLTVKPTGRDTKGF